MQAPERIDVTPATARTVGYELCAAARFEEALPLFRAAFETEPSSQAAQGVGLCMTELGQNEEALSWFDRAIVILRDEMIALSSNRGKALGELGRTDEALAMFNNILRSCPNHALSYYNRGLMLMQQGAHRAAILDFDQALKREPQNAKALFGRGFANLVLGNYAEGFRDYEYRLKDLIDEPDAPVWTGEQSLKGKTILIHGEQGHGDDIMFMRYVPAMLALGATVYAVLHPGVAPLFKNAVGVTLLTEDRTTWPKFDYWVRMMSLAWCLGTTSATVPPPAILTFDKAEWQSWRDRIAALTKPDTTLRVGLCWSGSPKSRYDAHRSVPLAELAPLLSIRGAQFFSLQLGVRDGDAEIFQKFCAYDHTVDLSSGLKDFSDTAHAIAQLDLVITCDTSVAHLAGTVGVPTWIMLTAFRTYWLWIEKRTTSPWYPSARLFRQERDGDWAGVVEKIRDNLVNVIAAPAA